MTHKIYGYRWLGIIYPDIDEARQQRKQTIATDRYFRWVRIQVILTDPSKDRYPLYDWTE